VPAKHLPIRWGRVRAEVYMTVRDGDRAAAGGSKAAGDAPVGKRLGVEYDVEKQSAG
jgi:hypothetical protein